MSQKCATRHEFHGRMANPVDIMPSPRRGLCCSLVMPAAGRKRGRGEGDVARKYDRISLGFCDRPSTAALLYSIWPVLYRETGLLQFTRVSHTFSCLEE